MANDSKRTKSGRLKGGERVFLVVVDESDEMRVALRFASLRAKATDGRVALFSAIEPTDFGHWQAVKERMEEELREEAEARLEKFADDVNVVSGKMPVIYIRYGTKRDVLLELLGEEPQISVLVLAAGTGGKGPGPLISHLTGKEYSKIDIPITIVPGTLSDEEIDAVT